MAHELRTPAKVPSQVHTNKKCPAGIVEFDIVMTLGLRGNAPDWVDRRLSW